MADTRTVIGAATRISGQLEGDEDLTIQGRVDGKIRLTKTLVIEPEGVVVADVDVRDLVVSGVLVGNVTASDSVHLTEQGRMVGDINAPRVIVVAGASFRGRVDMGDVDTARSGERPTPVRREVPSYVPAASRPAVVKAPSRPAPPPRAPVVPSVAASPSPATEQLRPPVPPPPPRPPLPAVQVAVPSAARRVPAPPVPRPIEGSASVSVSGGNLPPWVKKKLKRRA